MIRSKLEYQGKTYQVKYNDCDDFSVLPDKLCLQHLGVCFFENQIIIGLHSLFKPDWRIIGGTREEGEAVEETLTREILEESNMDVIQQIPIGYQKVMDESGKEEYQLRSWCRVRPRGLFVADPDHGIKEIKLIKPEEYKQYCDWGEIGDRIIERAVEIENRVQTNS